MEKKFLRDASVSKSLTLVSLCENAVEEAREQLERAVRTRDHLSSGKPARDCPLPRAYLGDSLSRTSAVLEALVGAEADLEPAPSTVRCDSRHCMIDERGSCVYEGDDDCGLTARKREPAGPQT